jgi:transcriptional regulator with XRE-family HTH domain
MKKKILTITAQSVPGKVTLTDIDYEKIVKEMEMLNISESQLVKKTQLSRQTVWRIVNNRIVYETERGSVQIKIESILLVARALGLALEFKFSPKQ